MARQRVEACITAKESRDDLAEEVVCPDASVESTVGQGATAPVTLEGGLPKLHAKAGPWSSLLLFNHGDILLQHEWVSEAIERRSLDGTCSRCRSKIRGACESSIHLRGMMGMDHRFGMERTCGKATSHFVPTLGI